MRRLTRARSCNDVYALVIGLPRAGVEPARLAAQDPKSCVAASYTTSATSAGAKLASEPHTCFAVTVVSSDLRCFARTASHCKGNYPRPPNFVSLSRANLLLSNVPAVETVHAC